MKKIALFFFIQFQLAYSQNNKGFEFWQSTLGVEFPANWNSLNALVFLGNDTSCKKLISAHSGNYSVLIKPIFFSSPSDTISGILYQKFAITSKPKSFNIFYKYTGLDSDSAYIKLECYKGAVQSSNLMGFSQFKFKKKSNWSLASSIINLYTNETPDTIVVSISTSNSNYKDSLILDDFEILNIVGINPNINWHNDYTFFYNQNLKLIKITRSSQINELKTILIRNILGVEIFKTSSFENDIQILDISPGIYFIEVTSNQNYLIPPKLIFIGY